MNNTCLKNSISSQGDESSEHFSKNYSCSCGAIFTNVDNLKQHSQLHNENKDFMCSLCSDTFQDFELLKLHDLRHSLEEANEQITDIDQLILPSGCQSCSLCDMKFSCDEEFISHSVIHPEMNNEANDDENTTASCNFINLAVTAENLHRYPVLRQQIIKTKTGNVYVRFILIDQENCHIEEFSRLQHKDVKPKFKPKKLISNFKGKSKSVKEKVLKKSRSVRKQPSVVVLESSGSEPEVVFEQKDLEASGNHPRKSKALAMKKKLWTYTPEIVIPKPKVCGICNKQFSTSRKCEEHVSTHHSSKISCKECHKKFSTESLLKRHKTICHNKGSPSLFPCSRCNLKFFSQKSLNVHRKEHYKNASVVCDKNGNVVCDNCNRCFKNAYTLMNHVCKITATTRCNICAYKFSRRNHLKRHLLRVHKFSKQEVEEMVPSLAYKKPDKSSTKRKTSLTPVGICVLCKNKFSDISSLRSHLLNFHQLTQSEVESLVHSEDDLDSSERFIQSSASSSEDKQMDSGREAAKSVAEIISMNERKPESETEDDKIKSYSSGENKVESEAEDDKIKSHSSDESKAESEIEDDKIKSHSSDESKAESETEDDKIKSNFSDERKAESETEDNKLKSYSSDERRAESETEDKIRYRSGDKTKLDSNDNLILKRSLRSHSKPEIVAVIKRSNLGASKKSKCHKETEHIKRIK